MQNKKTSSTTTVLGIDPGYDRVGIAILQKTKGQKETLVHSECFMTDPKDSFYDRVFLVGQKIESVIQKYKPEYLAIENLFITKNQKTAMRVSEARGIIIYEAVKTGLPVFEYSPPMIKTSITGDGKSDKAQIIKMIPMIIKMDTKNKKIIDDEYDAIAVALTAFAIEKL